MLIKKGEFYVFFGFNDEITYEFAFCFSPVQENYRYVSAGRDQLTSEIFISSVLRVGFVHPTLDFLLHSLTHTLPLGYILHVCLL